MASQTLSAQSVTVPANYKVTTSNLKNAASKALFVRVGKDKVTYRSLSGAPKLWNSTDPAENNDIFILTPTGPTAESPEGSTLRLTGTMQDVYQALTYLGYEANMIQQILQQAITKDNYQTTMRDLFEQEKANHKTLSSSARKQGRYAPEHFIFFANNLDKAEIIDGTGAKKAVRSKKAPKSPKGIKGSRKSLRERYEIAAAKENKAIDVSEIDLESAEGKGAKSVEWDVNKNHKGNKILVPGTRVVTNNVDKLIHALKVMYGEAQLPKYADIINSARQQLASKSIAPPMALPVPGSNVIPGMPQGMLPPPVVVQPAMVQANAQSMPGASLAPRPTFTQPPRVTTPPRAGLPVATGLPTLPGFGK